VRAFASRVGECKLGPGVDGLRQDWSVGAGRENGAVGTIARKKKLYKGGDELVIVRPVTIGFKAPSARLSLEQCLSRDKSIVNLNSAASQALQVDDLAVSTVSGLYSSYRRHV